VQDDLDFAYYFVTWEDAYDNAGRAVAMAWRRVKLLSEPGMTTDMAKISAVEATATKIRRVDERKKEEAVKKRKMSSASSLRQPGKGTAAEEKDDDKAHFIEPLTTLMMDCGVSRLENASATDEEMMVSLRRKAARVVKTAEAPTLNRAITTADEVRKYLEVRSGHMGIGKIEPMVLEDFLWKSPAPVRVSTALGWLCKNLDLGWPIDRIEKPCAKKVSQIGMECDQAPVAQPGMLKALADAMEAAAEKDEPTWIALLASWLQGMANLRLVHVLQRSFPVQRSEGWIVFFCKRGKQHHNRSGFYWGVPSETASGYKWTDKFLAEYERRRNSTQGKPMMGMIFRTDDYEYLPAKAVNQLTRDAVKGVVDNPERLSTYCWRRLLPTVSLSLNFSNTERLALGERCQGSW
jgi:hypothetical protein